MPSLSTWLRWTVISAICVLLVHVGAAHAAQTSDASPIEPYTALLAHNYMPLPDAYTVVPSPGGCPGQIQPGMTRPAACADSSMRVYVDPARVLDPTSNGATVLTHELGHIVDFTVHGSTSPDFNALMADVPGSRLEQFADVWAECSLLGPTADSEVVTPVYAFHIPAAAYAAACDLMRTLTQSFSPAPAVYSGAPWRMQAQPGDCMNGRFVVACPQPVAQAAKRKRRCSTYRKHHRPARCRHRSHR